MSSRPSIWWEWAHRFLGRLIGVAFLVPFVVFWIAGYIPRALLPRLLGLFVLGGLQGARRLVHGEERARRSHRCQPIPARRAFRRGAAHPRLHALAPVRSRRASGRPGAGGARVRRPMVAGAVLALIFLQLLAGALVAGLDAGMGYNTWPLINGAFVPSGPRRGLALVSATCSRTRLRCSSITACSAISWSLAALAAARLARAANKRRRRSSAAP